MCLGAFVHAYEGWVAKKSGENQSDMGCQVADLVYGRGVAAGDVVTPADDFDLASFVSLASLAIRCEAAALLLSSPMTSLSQMLTSFLPTVPATRNQIIFLICVGGAHFLLMLRCLLQMLG
jgi:hypothetical protein